MNILITGGAGFIGANLARHALDRGHEVRILDDLSTGYVDNLAGLRVDFLQASLLDVEALREAVRGIDSIVHLGALGSVPRSIADPLTTHHANTTGSLNVLEAARANGVEHVVCASSSSVYGMNPALPKHEREWVRPMSPYGVSKLASEQYTLAYQQSMAWPHVGVPALLQCLRAAPARRSRVCRGHPDLHRCTSSWGATADQR